VRITSKGQVTFPQAIHEQAGLDPRCEISFRLVGGQVFLEKVDSLGQRRADEGLSLLTRGVGPYCRAFRELVLILTTKPSLPPIAQGP
jgi:bifunctional DNA-binding transcriptional regulator/antitoxin component of YhaV-PrlF toxin-antitoxin module